ncbi:MAG: phosphoethanolamine transferase [Sulfuricurvum sp.]|uniref:phosphoethanolamine transferase n=1 Tax=Sulfuricurvum sp. TaxID=2025608 RepID=UPI0025D77EFF|nr:phosphoethanolamine transferase [Sulfuricurvum sp.]MCI4406293.1 phosphoethanolamine transferase [Sulfuricurvum sp.]
MKKNIQIEFHTNKSYFYFGTLISILTMLPQLIFSPNPTHSLFLSITLVLLIVIPKFSKILFSIFIIFINLSNIVIGHIALHWGYALADIKPRIEVAFLSPVYETKEYLSHYVDYRDYALGVFTFFVLFLLFKFLRHFTHSYKVFRMIGAGVFILILLSVTLFINPLREFEPFSVPCEICTVIEDKEKIDHILKTRAEFIAHLVIPKANAKNQLYDKIIIIMGESVNKNHMAIYGYSSPTTPFMSSLQGSKNFYLFNAIAPTNQTRYSIPIDLTEANVHYYENRYIHSGSLLTHFKANGYDTYWISNQGRAGKNDSTITSMASEANGTFFANLNYLDASLDEVLLEYLEKQPLNSKKEMYLLHLMGSHSDYVNRYNKQTALFNPAKNVVEEYDNTIYYTDYVVSRIFDHFKGKKLLLVYLSDHGENINLENNGHGFLPPYKDEYMVPFVIYTNVKNRRLDELSKDNKKGYFNLENLSSMIRYVSGISNHKNLSYSHDVMAVEPANIVDFEKLEMFN